MACLNAGVLVSSDEPFATASMVSSPDAGGSGNSLTPLSRMHLANFTAFSRLVAFVLPPLLPAPVSEDASEQPALITPIRATSARAPSGRRFFLMFTAASLDRG